MIKWYIKIDEVEFGPYSINELKKDRRITPETLARCVGDKRWRPIGEIKELEEIFKDEQTPPQDELADLEESQVWSSDEAILAANKDPSNLLLWFIIALLVLFWVLMQLK